MTAGTASKPKLKSIPTVFLGRDSTDTAFTGTGIARRYHGGGLHNVQHLRGVDQHLAELRTVVVGVKDDAADPLFPAPTRCDRRFWRLNCQHPRTATQ